MKTRGTAVTFEGSSSGEEFDGETLAEKKTSPEVLELAIWTCRKNLIYAIDILQRYDNICCLYGLEDYTDSRHWILEFIVHIPKKLLFV